MRIVALLVRICRFLYIVLFLLMLQFFFNSIATAEDFGAWRAINSYVECDNKISELNYKELQNEKQVLFNSSKKKPIELCRTAEILKRLGDYKAKEYYIKAIEAEPREPAFNIFYADYLRNIRGAESPLFSEAEKQYYEAHRKQERLENTRLYQGFDRVTKDRIERGLISLHQNDGLPLVSSPLNYRQGVVPNLFFSTINRFAGATSEFNEIDDVRDFTSEALFASSSQRLNRQLTNSELERIVRKKNQFETFNRIRFRYGKLPVLDGFYKHRSIKDAQITNFYEPNEFNNVELDEIGFSIEKSLDVSPYFDLFLRGAYSDIKRTGTIEFLENETEEIDQFGATVALSKFIGSDKLVLRLAYVYQDITPDVDNLPVRDRTIVAPTISYYLYRPIPSIPDPYDVRYSTRGLKLFAGFAYDQEKFDSANVNKNDYFIGASLKGLHFFNKLNRFDLTLQPTFFSSEVDNDSSQDNQQYRTNLTILYRLVDEERAPLDVGELSVSFLHFTIPLRYDRKIEGPDDFENYRFDLQLHGKFFIKKLRGTSFFASASYGHQSFYKLDKSIDLYEFSINIGF